MTPIDWMFLELVVIILLLLVMMGIFLLTPAWTYLMARLKGKPVLVLVDKNHKFNFVIPKIDGEFFEYDGSKYMILPNTYYLWGSTPHFFALKGVLPTILANGAKAVQILRDMFGIESEEDIKDLERLAKGEEYIILPNGEPGIKQLPEEVVEPARNKLDRIQKVLANYGETIGFDSVSLWFQNLRPEYVESAIQGKIAAMLKYLRTSQEAIKWIGAIVIVGLITVGIVWLITQQATTSQVQAIAEAAKVGVKTATDTNTVATVGKTLVG